MAVEALTYADLGQRLGCSPEAARSLVKRLRLPRQRANDGKTLVTVDLSEIEHKPLPAPVTGRSPVGRDRAQSGNRIVGNRACQGRGRGGRSPGGLRARARPGGQAPERGAAHDPRPHGGEGNRGPRRGRARRGASTSRRGAGGRAAGPGRAGGTARTALVAAIDGVRATRRRPSAPRIARAARCRSTAPAACRRCDDSAPEATFERCIVCISGRQTMPCRRTQLSSIRHERSECITASKG